MNIYKVEFEPMWPVGCALVIAAESIEQAADIASTTIDHTNRFTIVPVDISTPGVIVYLSGDY